MRGTITVKVQLKESSQPIVYENVVNTYQKGDLYVLYTEDEKSYKHPINTIWRIVEEYGYHGRIGDLYNMDGSKVEEGDDI